MEVDRRFNPWVLEKHVRGRYSVAPAAPGWVQWVALERLRDELAEHNREERDRGDDDYHRDFVCGVAEHRFEVREGSSPRAQVQAQ